MKKKIKLRDMTVEQWYNNKALLCKLFGNRYCDDFIFQGIESYTASYDKNSGFNNNDFYNNRFLDLEIEIDIPDILNKEEKEYLSNIIRPFRSRIVRIRKCVIKFGAKKDETFYYLQIIMKSRTKILCNKLIDLPLPDNKKYRGMKFYKQYTLEELGL